ncbi:copper amine oxidase N-terminal domain-containing protein [Ammoniphilus sp. YIM 78166]|uniref:copper amine oxidase N-terminal domain-containing protein n=1 Tax=Ammoniphilus sp. YIM 78166 TaxID=1644106 RepID=UPI0035189661
MKLNGKTISFDQPSINDNGSIQVPAQTLFEALGIKSVWDKQTHTIPASQGDTKLIVPVKLVNGVPMISVRFVSETFGAKVTWIKATRSVEIITN